MTVHWNSDSWAVITRLPLGSCGSYWNRKSGQIWGAEAQGVWCEGRSKFHTAQCHGVRGASEGLLCKTGGALMCASPGQWCLHLSVTSCFPKPVQTCEEADQDCSIRKLYTFPVTFWCAPTFLSMPPIWQTDLAILTALTEFAPSLAQSCHVVEPMDTSNMSWTRS